MTKEKMKKVLTLPKEVIHSGIFHKTRNLCAKFFKSKSSASKSGPKGSMAKSKALPGGRGGAEHSACHSFHRKEPCSDGFRS